MKNLAYFFVMCACLGSWASTAAAAEKPNVLFLAIDDLNTWALEDENRYTGTVIAPAIRQLASEGVLFKRAYCAAPKCSPSRTSVLSGIAPWVSGIYENAQIIEQSVPLQAATELRQYFKQNGYYVASAGKINHGWKTESELDASIKTSNRDPYPPKPLSPIANGGEVDWGPLHIPESEMNDTRNADFAIEQLQKDHDKPFFIACGLFHPHMPWYVPQKYLDMYPLEDIHLPPFKEGDLEDLGKRAQRLVSGVYHKAVEHGEYKKALQGYLASSTYADMQMQRVLEALAASQYKDNTIVVLWSDHGFHVGEKEHWQKSTLWEEATNCLLIVKAPGVSTAGQPSERLVSLLDIYPTLLELCGLPAPPQPLDGASLVPLLKNPQANWSDHVFTGFMRKGTAKAEDVFMSVRSEDFRFIRYGGGEEEFYDRGKDPNEWDNLITNPEYKAEIDRHRALLPQHVDPMPTVQRGGGKKKK